MIPHTPLPWKFHASFRDSAIYASGVPVAKVLRGKRSGYEQDANAELIVRAVNSHDDLLKAAALLAGHVEDFLRLGKDATWADAESLTKCVVSTRAAIAKAEGIK